MNATCTLCFRIVNVDASGKMVEHSHTPMLSGARCEGTGRTPEEAKKYGIEELRKYREQKKAAK